MGIDTSNYTTSVALLTQSGKLLANIKRPLPVETGKCGLRQSDAVFHHVKNLPECMKEAREVLSGRAVSLLGVSERPRNTEGSYMPCFLAGVAAAQSIGASLGIPVLRFSHQCGHIMAALYSSGNMGLLGKSFGAFHVSGGTTDLLFVKPGENGFLAERVGGSEDLNAGQAIDRIGVAMGLSFPAGREMEELAYKCEGKIISRRPKLKDMQISLSGLENLALKLYRESGDKSLVARFTLDYIYNGISALADAYIEKFGEGRLIFSGGVMSNSIIKERIEKKYDAGFARPSLSADNAVGIAVLAGLKLN